MSGIMIEKRSGRLAPLDLSKIKVQTRFACKGVDTVSVMELEVNCMFKFTDGMKTSRIQEILIDTAKNMITEENHGYSIVAARLMSHDLRKRVYGTYEPPTFYAHVRRMVEAGHYDKYILEQYTGLELMEIGSLIEHERDNDFSLAGLSQMMEKYLLRDRSSPDSDPYETPQMLYMAVSCVLMAKYFKGDKSKRMELIKDFYDGASTFAFSLPTPILGGVRTKTRQFSSCVLIDTDDTLNSINATASTIVNYVSKRAGIGLNQGRIRAEGASIRNGEMKHTGVIPFLKYHVGALKSCSQGGIRGGSATSFYPMWHLQIEDVLVLKNNRGVTENRERRSDYGIQIGDEMYERLLNDSHIYLFDPGECPDLYEAYFDDTNERFHNLYAQYIQKAEQGQVRYKRIKAADLFLKMMEERAETGRIFIKNTQTVNGMSPFKKSRIYQSNLCLEVCVPTIPFQSLEDESGRIGLCTLASMNMAKFISDVQQMVDLPKYIRVLVYALDSLLDYQDYPAIQAKSSTLDWRTLGMGVVNLADFIMKNDGKYGDPHILKAVNQFMQRMSYHAKMASNELAQEFGPCRRSDEVVRSVTELHDERFGLDKLFNLEPDPLLDFEALYALEEKYGYRHATLFALAPTESSSQVLNATNGVEMPRGFLSIKSSKDGQFNQVVPTPERGNEYDYLWDHADPVKYLMTIAVLQRSVDQSISTNTFYNPSKFPGGKIPRQKIIEDLLLVWKLGIKTLYYNNIPDGATDVLEAEPEAAEAINEEVCDTCTI